MTRDRAVRIHGHSCQPPRAAYTLTRRLAPSSFSKELG
jgi:hypothetical protein